MGRDQRRQVGPGDRATALLHGRDAATNAKETAKSTFAGGSGGDLPTLAVGDGMTVAQALTGLDSPLERRAKRKVAEGAVRLNDR